MSSNNNSFKLKQQLLDYRFFASEFTKLSCANMQKQHKQHYSELVSGLKLEVRS